MIDKIANEGSSTPEIQPANEIIVSLFFAVTTQWRYAGMSGARTGLDYNAVRARAEAHSDYCNLKPKYRDRVWAGLQLMELAALTHWQSSNER